MLVLVLVFVQLNDLEKDDENTPLPAFKVEPAVELVELVELTVEGAGCILIGIVGCIGTDDRLPYVRFPLFLVAIDHAVVVLLDSSHSQSSSNSWF